MKESRVSEIGRMTACLGLSQGLHNLVTMYQPDMTACQGYQNLWAKFLAFIRATRSMILHHCIYSSALGYASPLVSRPKGESPSGYSHQDK